MVNPYRSKDPGTRWGSTTLGHNRNHCRRLYKYIYSNPIIDLNEALKPLIDQLKKYDALRLRLEQRGGRFSHLNRITEILSNEILIRSRFRTNKITLTDQASLRSMLNDVGDFDLHMDVRQLDTRMPAFYLCRIRRDYWSEYSLIVEDLYKSPGYPTIDERFVKLMRAGHEAYYLRLSQFRKSVLPTVATEDTHTLRCAVDEILHNLGRHVFQAAWHEDQRIGIAAASHFDLPCFRNAIELLYLCLCGELCELRGVVNEQMHHFFDQVYPQPAIHAFLDMLTRLDGSALTDLPQKALKLYMRLSLAFSRFLGIEVTWGHRKKRIPVYKLIFANFSRLHLVAKELEGNKNVHDAAARLESESQLIINELLAEPRENTHRMERKWSYLQ